MRRTAFTLMELLIVITIIAVLAGLAFPAFGMIKGKARDIQCSNNLRQIAIALETYRQDDGTQERFPQRLLTDAAANDPIGGISLATWGRGELPPKLFLCPHDGKRGADPNMGRKVGGNWGSYPNLYEAGSSFMYEVSSRRDGALFTANEIGYFYRMLPANQRPAVGEASWAEGKLLFQQRGNLVANWASIDASQGNPGCFGNAFASSDLPIVRCYHHADWNAVADTVRKVNNISLAFSVWQSSPYWERDANPAIR